MRKRSVLTVIVAAVVAPLLVFFSARSIVFDWYRTGSAAMAPTIPAGAHFLLALKCAYQVRLPFTGVTLFRTGTPRRGDLVVLRNPDGGRTPFLQRVIGLGGDEVELRNEELILNGRRLGTTYRKGALEPEEELLGDTSLDGVAFTIRVLPNRPAFRTFGPIRVPKGEVFLMGDNRDESRDSRFYGTRPVGDLLGRLYVPK